MDRCCSRDPGMHTHPRRPDPASRAHQGEGRSRAIGKTETVNHSHSGHSRFQSQSAYCTIKTTDLRSLKKHRLIAVGDVRRTTGRELGFNPSVFPAVTTNRVNSVIQSTKRKASPHGLSLSAILSQKDALLDERDAADELAETGLASSAAEQAHLQVFFKNRTNSIQ